MQNTGAKRWISLCGKIKNGFLNVRAQYARVMNTSINEKNVII
jgi:hypothetical protein